MTKFNNSINKKGNGQNFGGKWGLIVLKRGVNLELNRAGDLYLGTKYSSNLRQGILLVKGNKIIASSDISGFNIDRKIGNSGSARQAYGQQFPKY